MFILILIGLSCLRTSALKAGDTIRDEDCLTFTAIDGSATIKFSWAAANKVLFSVDDGDNWFNYDLNKEVSLKPGKSVKFKGSGITTGLPLGRKGFETLGGDLSVSGNLNSLRLDDNLERFVDLEYVCFSYMFANCKNLVDASQLVLNAEILEPFCYYGMFDYCKNLTKVPDLPESSLANDCYAAMFRECTNIKFSESMTDKYNKKWTIKTDNGNSGYKSMFDGCAVIWLKNATENSTVTLYQKEKDNLMGSNGLTGSYNNDNKSELLSTASEEQETSDDIDSKYEQLSDMKSSSSNQLGNSQSYESKSSKSLADSKNSDSVSSNLLTSNQNSSGSSNAAKSSAIKTVSILKKFKNYTKRLFSMLIGE